MFSSQIKDEISNHIYEKNCCEKAEIAAMIRVAGVDSQVKKEGLNLTYKDAGIIFGERDIIIEQYISGQKRCCKKAYLRGAFLAGGSLSNPDKGYHLEIVCRDAMIAEEIEEILEEFNIFSKVVERKDHFVLYIKEAEQIADFLNIIGAHNSLMEFENVRILKEVRNNVNRQVNCETANIQKTVDASIRQIENIRFLVQTGELNKLSPQLKEAAILRLENPDTNLSDLCSLMKTPISKSGMNHRLRKIDEMACSLRANQ